MEFEKVGVAANANKDAVVDALAQANAVIDQANAMIDQLTAQAEERDEQIKQLSADLAAAKAQSAQAVKSQHAGKGTHLRVSSAHPAGSHWRAGRQWTRVAQDVEIKSLTPDQVVAMRADGNLVVVDI